MVWKATDPQGNESKKIVWEAARYLRGRGLDLGAGSFRVLPHVTTVDNMHHAHMFGFNYKPDIVSDVEKLDVIASQSMDFVFSSHALEHIVDYKSALKEWWRVVKQGGHLVLYLPHKQFYPNIGEPGANPDHKHDFLPEDIVSAMPDGFDLVQSQERDEGTEYSFLLVFKKLNSKQRLESFPRHRPEKSACVVRYGAYGDLMQTASVLCGLKSQGYHVTLITSAPGCDVVTEDPHIDDMIVFDKDQVPNQDLAQFWGYWQPRFDRWVNLSESVEGTLLALPGRTIHMYPPGVRHRMMNMNYMDLAHDLAGVPRELNVKFYATAEEKKWAANQRKKVGGDKVVVWSLAGSSVHKTWAGLDAVLARFMLERPQWRVVLVGGPECAMLEAGWENEPRVVKTCGKWSIRQTFAFLDHADFVMGPETGVLNAAACLSIPKLVFLSHSTVENLTRDWVNTVSLWGRSTKCPGRGDNSAPACHQLHYGWANCARDEETGTAQCQKDITVDEVWKAICDATA